MQTGSREVHVDKVYVTTLMHNVQLEVGKTTKIFMTVVTNITQNSHSSNNSIY